MACYQAPRHPFILNFRHSWLYIPRRVFKTPRSIPMRSNMATDIAFGLKSKHLV